MVMEAWWLRELASDYEVIVIENGSTDYAWDVLDELERLYGVHGVDPLDRGNVRIIRFDRALDYGGALRAEFGACRYNLIFYTDGRAVRRPRAARPLRRLGRRRRTPGGRGDGEQDHPSRPHPPALHLLDAPPSDGLCLPVQGA